MQRTLTCLVRTPAALDAARAALMELLQVGEQLPAHPGISPLPAGAHASALPLAPRLTLELLHLPPSLLPFHWREGQQLHLLSASLCEAAAAQGALPALLAQAASGRSRVAGALHSLRLLPSGLPLPQLQLHLAAPSEAAAAAAPPPLPPQAPAAEGALKELVLGVPDGGALAAAQERLAAIATRAQGSLAVWHLHCGTLPRVRLLPSAYSALVFHTASLGDLLARSSSSSSGSSAGLALHGQRHGVDGVAGNGQLRARGAALAGLDVRFCSSAGVPGMFAEDERTLTDLMDPQLNNVEGKKEALACKSIVGMDLVSTLRLRLSGRVG